MPLARCTCCSSLAGALQQFLVILHLRGIFLFQKIAHPARVFLNQHQGIVDLVGHAGGHLAQSRHLAGLEHAGVNMRLLAVGGGQRRHQPPRGNHRPETGNHRAPAAPAAPPKAAAAAAGWRAVGHVVHHDKNPGHGLKAHHGHGSPGTGMTVVGWSDDGVASFSTTMAALCAAAPSSAAEQNAPCWNRNAATASEGYLPR